MDWWITFFKDLKKFGAFEREHENDTNAFQLISFVVYTLQL